MSKKKIALFLTGFLLAAMGFALQQTSHAHPLEEVEGMVILEEWSSWDSAAPEGWE